jgi:hypothetical protein
MGEGNNLKGSTASTVVKKSEIQFEAVGKNKSLFHVWHNGVLIATGFRGEELLKPAWTKGGTACGLATRGMNSSCFGPIVWVN